MRSKTAKWFEVTVRLEKIMEDGMQKKVTEVYVVEALSFTEAEAKITEEMKSFVSGEFEVVSEKIAPYAEVFFSDNLQDDCWYKAKLQFITIDEKTDKEKRSNIVYLVQADSLDTANKYVSEFMSSSMIDYVKCNISDTKIMDVYEHSTPKEDKEEC
jgi:hypothetical protein